MMKKFVAITFAAALAGAAHTQVATSSEKTVHTETTQDGAVKTTTEHRTETNVNSAPAPAPATVVVPQPYVTRLEAAYKYAGVPQADVVRLTEIDRRAYQAHRANVKVDLNPYYVEQTRILQPAQVTKVRTYLTEHPLPPKAPAYEITTYEKVPARAGVQVNTPIGNIGVGVPTGSRVIEHKEVVPAQ